MGGPALTEAIGSGGILADAELRTVLGTFPLSSLATFTGLGITNDVIRRFVQSS